MSKSLYEAARNEGTLDDKAIEKVAVDGLKKAGLKHTGKVAITRNYGWGAEVHATLGSVGKNRVWLEITLDTTPPNVKRIELRMKAGGQSQTLASDGDIKALARLLSKVA